MSHLSGDVMNKIFEYLSLGEIYYSFYHLDPVRNRRLFDKLSKEFRFSFIEI